VIGTLGADNEFFGFGFGLDTLTGGNQRDIFHMNYDLGHVDIIDGGAGQDLVDYSGANRGLEIHLGVGGAPGIVRYVVTTPPNVMLSGDPANPWPVITENTVTHELTTLINIEDVVGTNYNDTITGTFGDNVLDGGSGDDLLKGYAGNDTLLGDWVTTPCSAARAQTRSTAAAATTRSRCYWSTRAAVPISTPSWAATE
jgi:Ca2+-binding RTX toxin-like protein